MPAATSHCTEQQPRHLLPSAISYIVSQEFTRVMPNDPVDCARAKAAEMLQEAFGVRALDLCSSRSITRTMHAIRDAFATELTSEQAAEVGFHMADWGEDAAFVVAVHLFPERFTAEEIRGAARMFAAHVPYHAAAVADILGFPGSDFIGSDAHTNEG